VDERAPRAREGASRGLGWIGGVAMLDRANGRERLGLALGPALGARRGDARALCAGLLVEVARGGAAGPLVGGRLVGARADGAVGIERRHVAELARRARGDLAEDALLAPARRLAVVALEAQRDADVDSTAALDGPREHVGAVAALSAHDE